MSLLNFISMSTEVQGNAFYLFSDQERLLFLARALEGHGFAKKLAYMLHPKNIEHRDQHVISKEEFHYYMSLEEIQETEKQLKCNLTKKIIYL